MRTKTNQRPTEDDTPKSPKKNTSKKDAALSEDTPSSHWGYENDPDAEIWRYSAFSHSGAFSMAKTMRDKFGCTIVEKPYERENGTWGFAFTNPLRK